MESRNFNHCCQIWRPHYSPCGNLLDFRRTAPMLHNRFVQAHSSPTEKAYFGKYQVSLHVKRTVTCRNEGASWRRRIEIAYRYISKICLSILVLILLGLPQGKICACHMANPECTSQNSQVKDKPYPVSCKRLHFCLLFPWKHCGWTYRYLRW